MVKSLYSIIAFFALIFVVEKYLNASLVESTITENVLQSCVVVPSAGEITGSDFLDVDVSVLKCDNIDTVFLLKGSFPIGMTGQTILNNL